MNPTHHIKNILKELQKRFFSNFCLSKTGSVALILISLLSSCSDSDTPVVLNPDSPQTEEDYNLTISIPDMVFGNSLSTRDVGDETENNDKKKDPIEASEGTLQSLYMVIYQIEFKDGAETKSTNVFCSDIKSTSTINGTITSEYNQYKYYNHRLGEGTYRLYLLGNIEEYWQNPDTTVFKTSDDGSESAFVSYLKGEKQYNSTTPSGEENLKNIVLQYNGLIPSGHLPMICLPTDITEDKDGEKKLKNEGLLTITTGDVSSKNNKTLYAPLTFICSKVRLTVLFNNTAFSSAFSEPDINFTQESRVDEDGNILYLTTNEKGIRVDNLRGKSRMIEDSEVTDTPSYLNSSYFTSISKCAYPSSQDEDEKKYFSITSLTKDDSSPAYLTRLGVTESWDPETQRAWQSSAIYLPENPVSDYINVTTLHVVPSGTNVPVEGYFIPLKDLGTNYPTLQRDCFYDIVAKMKKKEDFAIGVSIKVNAWKFHDITASW